MRSPIFSRGLLTDFVLDTLAVRLAERQVALLIGDGVAPTAGGWTGGQPGQGTFSPYVVITPGTAGRGDQDAMGNIDSSWRARYSIRSVGGSRQQVEWAGDMSRRELSTLPRQDLDLDGPWTLLQAQYESLGAPGRNDSTDPPYWEATDGVALWMERT